MRMQTQPSSRLRQHPSVGPATSPWHCPRRIPRARLQYNCPEISRHSVCTLYAGLPRPWRDAGHSARSSTSDGTSTSSNSNLDSSASLTMDLQLVMKRARAYDEYASEISKPSNSVDYLKCAVLIAQQAFPEVTYQDIQEQVEQLAESVRKQLPETRYPMRVLQTINKVLFQDHEFHGNTSGYYHPDNTYINMVLQRRTGIPISLSLVYMEVAKRVGLPMKGVNLPGHFMIKPDVEGMEILVDPFNQGEIRYLEDAQELLSSLLDQEVRLSPEFVQGKHDVPAKLFFLRMLNNVKQLYVASMEVEMALRIIRLMRATEPQHLSEMRDEGLCLYSLQRYSESLEVLAAYLQASPTADDAAMVFALMEGCKTKIKQQSGVTTETDDAG